MFHISIESSIVQEISFSSLNEYSTKLFVKRDDLIHEFVSGNKWRKLKYAIEHCHTFNFNGIVTYGGAYSNHILACAAACHIYNLKSIAYIRGDELTSSSNALLAKCKELGMELLFISRDAYDAMKRDNSTVEIDGSRYLSIPEGGANRFGIMGCMEILPDTDNNFDVVALAQGTTTTYGNAGNQALYDVTKTVIDIVTGIIKNTIDLNPVIRIPQGARMTVIVNDDIVVPFMRKK